MRVAAFRGAGAIRLEQAPEPVAGPGEIVVSVRAAGICGSDLDAYEHGLHVEIGQVMGHEFAGQVAAVGAGVDEIEVGDRVAVMPYVPCARCRACRSDRPHLCPSITSNSIAYGLPGGFAELVRIPNARLGHSVHRIADHVDYDTAALAEPFAVALHGTRVAGPSRGRVLVLGQGPIGLLVVQALRIAGRESVIAVDISPIRLNASAELGASETIRADGGTVSNLLAAQSLDADTIIECTGVAPLVGQAVRAVAPGGSVVAMGVYGERIELDPALIVRREVRLEGSFAATSADFAEAVALINAGKLRPGPVISHRFPLDEVEHAFAVQADRSSAIKVMLAPL